MNLNYSEEHQQFRREVADFLARNWQTGTKGSKQERLAFRQLAIDAGYLYRNVPREYGGSEQPLDIVRGQIIAEEFAKAGAPAEVASAGVWLVVPVLLAHGTEAQKRRFILPTLQGEMHWAQGFSEPEAGSDLANLKTKGELRGDKWIVNGSKIWTTLAQHADFMFALVRTEPGADKHAGISYLLLDMNQPGVRVRPFKTLTGDQRFCEVHLEDAVAPLEWMVGERGRGWELTRQTLATERSGAVFAVAAVQGQFDRVLDAARHAMIDGRPAIEDSYVQDRLVRLSARLEALRYSAYRNLSLVSHGQPDTLFGYSQKLLSSTLTMDISILGAELAGDALLGASDEWRNPLGFEYLRTISSAIAGGTSNIQRNIIAERGLGLPRE